MGPMVHGQSSTARPEAPNSGSSDSLMKRLWTSHPSEAAEQLDSFPQLFRSTCPDVAPASTARCASAAPSRSND